MVAITPALRFAIYSLWPEKCVWCTKPITFMEMQVDHLIPKSVTGHAAVQALATHGLPSDFDLDAEENLAPSCGPCNSSKNAKIPPAAPGITLLLAKAADRADKVRDAVKKAYTHHDVEKAFGQIYALDTSIPEVLEAFTMLAPILGEFLASLDAAKTTFTLTDDLHLQLNEDGDWAVTEFDCPNRSCFAGEVIWDSWPDGSGGSLRAGTCYACGTWAVACPACDSVNGFVFDSLHCDGCSNEFGLVWATDGSVVEDVVLTTRTQ